MRPSSGSRRLDRRAIQLQEVGFGRSVATELLADHADALQFSADDELEEFHEVVLASTALSDEARAESRTSWSRCKLMTLQRSHGAAVPESVEVPVTLAPTRQPSSPKPLRMSETNRIVSSGAEAWQEA